MGQFDAVFRIYWALSRLEPNWVPAHIGLQAGTSPQAPLPPMANAGVPFQTIADPWPRSTILAHSLIARHRRLLGSRPKTVSVGRGRLRRRHLEMRGPTDADLLYELQPFTFGDTIRPEADRHPHPLHKHLRRPAPEDEISVMNQPHDLPAHPFIIAVVGNCALDSVTIHHRDPVGQCDHFGHVAGN